MIKKFPMSRIRQRYTKLKIDRKWILMILVVVLLSFLIDIKPVIYIILFSVANSLLLTIDRYINAPIDLELSTFTGILMSLKFGVSWGIACAILTKVAAIIYNRNVRMDHIFMIGGYCIAAITANLLRSMDIVAIGVIATIIVNIYTVFVSKYVTMLSNYEIVMYGSTNAAFNIVLFIGFSNIFMLLMF